jgi:hypothetical protein
LEQIRARTGNTVPILAWVVVNVFMALRISGPEELGGIGDVPAKARILAEKTGRNEKDLMDEVTLSFTLSRLLLNDLLQLAHPNTGALVTLPGLPPFYDYEWSPQEARSPFPLSIYALINKTNQTLFKVDNTPFHNSAYE